MHRAVPRSVSEARARSRAQGRSRSPAGVLVLFVALATPLDTLGDEYLFTAHMIQHLLLTLGAAPLLLAGTPELAVARRCCKRRT